MPHPKDNEVIPIGTKCLWKKYNREVIIVDHGFGSGGNGFLNYYINELGPKARKGNFAAYHDDLQSYRTKSR